MSAAASPPATRPQRRQGNRNQHRGREVENPVRLAELALEALRLKRAGASDQGVAEAMGCAKSTAQTHLKRGMDMLREETVDVARDVQHMVQARLDDALRTAMQTMIASTPATSAQGVLVREGNPELALRAAGEIRKIEMERARLVGAIAPTQISFGPPAGGGIPTAIRDELAMLDEATLDRDLAMFDAGAKAQAEMERARKARKRQRRKGTTTKRKPRKGT